jgi:hypothetical protein
MSLAFLFCIDTGPLEQQGVLLARSIRRWAGAYADAPIHAYQPREGSVPLPHSTRAELDELGVVFHEERLNRELSHDRNVNRVFVGAHAEASLTETILVLCDTDTAFVGEPTGLDLGPERDAGVRPVGVVNTGSTGPGHRNDEYWLRMYELVGVTERPFVRTLVSRKRIRACWNAGLVTARRESGVLGQWLDVLRTLVRADHVLQSHRYPAMDQLSLAAALAVDPSRVKKLGAPYNYPIQKRPVLPRRMRDLDLTDLVHVHYHRWFNRPGFLERVEPPLDRSTPQFRWLAERLPLEPTIDDPMFGRERRALHPDERPRPGRANPYLRSEGAAA